MRRFSPVVWAVVVAVLTLHMVRLPTSPASAQLDASWNATLIHANLARLHSGRDIVFSYGPLGHMATSLHIGQPMAGRMLFESAYVLLNVLGIVAVAVRLPAGWAAALLVLTALAPIPGGKDSLTTLGMVCWGVSCYAAGPRTAVACAAGLGLLLGSAALIKFSWCVVGCLTAAVVLADLLLRRRWVAAAILPATALACGLALWLACGQPIDGFGDYVRAASEIAAGFPQAMAVTCKFEKLLPGLVTVACIAGAIVASVPPATATDGRHAVVRRALCAAWLLAVTFIIWKHGFVRADLGHFMCFYGVACLLPCALMALPPATARLASIRRACAVVALLILAGTLRKQPLLAILAQPFHTVPATVRQVLDPGGYQRAVVGSWERSRPALALPRIAARVGTDSVDVFGAAQTYAIANGLTFTPRPVFQGYAAYTRELGRRNADFYRSARAPAWSLFDLQSIDWRLPPLDDSRCLAEILHAYRFVDDEGPFLLLERRETRPLAFELCDEGSGTVGTAVDLRRHLGDDIWLEIDVHPGVLARLRTILLRPPQLRIRITPETPAALPANAPPTWNAPLSMLAAGFLATPLCLSTADAKEVLRGGSCRRTSAITLEPGPGGSKLAGATFDYRVFRLTPRVSAATLPDTAADAVGPGRSDTLQDRAASAVPRRAPGDLP
jgi:hypothetical protein